MSVSVPDLTLALHIEKLIYNKMMENENILDINSNSNNTSNSNNNINNNNSELIQSMNIRSEDSMNPKNDIINNDKNISTVYTLQVMDFAKPGHYTSTMNRIAFALNVSVCILCINE